MMSMIRFGLGGLFCAVLAACGGGDSGGSGASSVTVHLDSPRSLRAEVLEGLALPDMEWTGSVSGDVSSLSGKTVYVTIVDPDHLFDQAPLFTQTSNNGLTVGVRGAVQGVPRHAVGNISINVCLDAACSQPLGGSPLQLPYDVNILAGLTVDTTPISANYRFGDEAIVRTLDVTLPKYFSGWYAQTLESDGSPSRHVGVALAPGAPGQTAAITLTFVPSAPGVYSGLLRIYGGAETPDNQSMSYTRDVVLDYTVSDNPAVTAFYYPSRLDLSISQAAQNAVYPQFWVIARSEHVESYPVIEYVSAPPAAAGHPDVAGWLFLYPEPEVSDCFYNNGITGPVDCLPTGTYTALIHTTSTVDGASVDLTLPVTMTVTP